MTAPDREAFLETMREQGTPDAEAEKRWNEFSSEPAWQPEERASDDDSGIEYRDHS